MSDKLCSAERPTHGRTAQEQEKASAYIAEARHRASCELEIDDDPAVSIVDDEGEANGAWVAAWVRVGEDELATFRRGRVAATNR